MDRSEKLARLRAFLARPNPPVLFDEPGRMLLDVSSGKTLALDLAELEGVEERVDRGSGRPYLVLRFGDGRRLALTDAGIAFAPDFRNSGPVPELPEAVCFRDWSLLLARLEHELYAHPDREPSRDTVGLVMACIAVLDGARAQGFDVGREERRLETHLAELERRAPRGR